MYGHFIDKVQKIILLERTSNVVWTHDNIMEWIKFILGTTDVVFLRSDFYVNGIENYIYHVQVDKIVNITYSIPSLISEYKRYKKLVARGLI